MCLSTAAGSADVPEAAAADVEEASFVAVHRRFWAAFSNRDLWGISELWDLKDELASAILPASSTPAVGWLSVADSFRRTFAHNRNIRVDVARVHWERREDVAWLVSAVRFEAIQTQTGQPIRMDRMLVTEILERRDGVWKMIHYHAHYPDFALSGLEPSSSDVIAAPVRTRAGSPLPEDAAVWALYDRFNGALQGQDLEGMTSLFSTDGVVTVLQPRSPVPFVGRENVASSWKRSFEEIDGLEMDPARTILGGRDHTLWITEFGSLQLILEDARYKVLHFPIMATFVFRRDAVGWRIAHYHSHLAAFDDGHGH